MRILLLTALLIAMGNGASGQRHALTAINAETPEGKLLQQISQEPDPNKKLAPMEQFISQFPKHDAAGWVLTQMQGLYVKGNNFDKALSTGEALLAMDAEDIDAAYANLKAAEGKVDPDLVLKWSAQTSQIAKKALAAPKREGDDEATYKQAQDFAKQVNTYTEYALYNTALKVADEKKTLEMADTLATRNPNSQYIAQVMPKYVQAAKQLNQMPRAIAYGERAYEKGLFNEDMLLTLSDYQMQNKQPAKVIMYTTKAVELMSSKPKPEGVDDAQWQQKKDSIIGIAQWMQGVTLSSQNKFAEADKALRVALPLVQANEQLRAGALFHLGLANYKMAQTSKNKGQINDAVKYMEQAAAIKSPFQAQAAKNVPVIKKEFALR
jgi:hypothetical protein